MDINSIKLILGIGNPEAAFENTYHNAGILALRHLANLDEASPFRRAPHKAFSYAKGKRFLFACSLTYMNESGRSAQDACAFFKVPPGALLVLHDESDLVLGSFKTSVARGAAGHKGVASIAHALGTNTFARVRIGIRPRAHFTTHSGCDASACPRCRGARGTVYPSVLHSQRDKGNADMGGVPKGSAGVPAQHRSAFGVVPPGTASSVRLAGPGTPAGTQSGSGCEMGPQETIRKKAGEFVLSPITPGNRAALTRVFGEIARSLGFENEAD